MKENSTEIVIVLDRSGSMETIRPDMEGGFAVFVEEQKKLPGECRVTLVQFDTGEPETVYSRLLLADVPPLRLKPRGGTALFDAVASTIDSVGARLAATPEAQRPARVLFLIVTDGGENASRKFDAWQVKERIEHQRTKYSWDFVYLGANQDAFKVAEGMGISFASGYAANAGGVKGVFRGASYVSNSVRSGEQYTSGQLIASVAGDTQQRQDASDGAKARLDEMDEFIRRAKGAALLSVQPPDKP